MEHIDQVQLKRQVKQLEQELMSQRQSQSPKVKVNKLETELNQSRQQLCDQRDFFEKRLQQLQDKHEKEVSVLTAKLQDYRRRLEKSNTDHQSQQDCLHNMNLKYAETVRSYEQHVSHLEARLNKAMSASTTKTAISQDLQRFEREKAALKDALRRATNELAGLESAREECDRLRMMVGNLQSTINHLHADMEAMRQPYAKAKSTAEYYEQSMGVVQQRLQRLGEENRYLRSLINNAHK